MSFWNNCEHLMVEYDLTQEGFARMIGASPAAVTKWKNGTIPRISTLNKICETFSVSFDDLMSQNMGLSNQPDELTSIQVAFVRMNEEGRKALAAVAEALLATFADEGEE